MGDHCATGFSDIEATNEADARSGSGATDPRGAGISRRSALLLMATAMPGSLYLFGCGSSSKQVAAAMPVTPNRFALRPRFHLTPAFGWINDPQRPLWIGNQWNLWILWNGDYPTGNGTAWRRYTSSDLVKWGDQGVSIPKYTNAYGDVWTGSSVIDTDNSAGYGAGTVIALMTMPCESLGGQSTALWYSTDNGVSFQFGEIVQKNPLAGNATIADLVFRDPCVFWHVATGRWIMSIAEVGKLSIYSSSDLKNWVYESSMARNDLGTMECPHLFELHLYAPDGSTTEDKWILLCGANGTVEGFTIGTAYWIGSFDGRTFTPDALTPQWLDHGPDFYATTVFADPRLSDPLTYCYAIAWENNWDYAKAMPTEGYYGQLSITRRLRLQEVNGLPVLLNLPLNAEDSVFSSSIEGTDQTISDGVPYQWPTWQKSPSYKLDFTVSSDGGSWPTAMQLLVRAGSGESTAINFEPETGGVSLDRSKCGPAPNSDSAWSSSRQAACDFASPVLVSVFVDTGSVEVFLNGMAAMSALITTPPDITGLALTATGGSAEIYNVVIRY